MKRNFNKEFKEEFKKSFDNSLDKESLKDNLNLIPQKEETLTFSKKPFYRVTSVLTVLLILVTASLTFLITYYVDYNKNICSNHPEEVDAVEFFQERYNDCNIKLITKINVRNNLSISLVRISNKSIQKLALYFHKDPTIDVEASTYKIFVNEFSFEGIILNKNEFIEYELQIFGEININFIITKSNIKIFEFCTKI